MNYLFLGNGTLLGFYGLKSEYIIKHHGENSNYIFYFQNLQKGFVDCDENPQENVHVFPCDYSNENNKYYY